jgi:hypothetical protein
MKYPSKAVVLGRKIVAVVDNSGTDLRDSTKRVKCLTVYFPERGPDSPAKSFSLFGAELEELLELLDISLSEDMN